MKYKDRRLVKLWAVQYGLTKKQLHGYTMDEWEQLIRMQDHARATIFSSLKWTRDHRGWKSERRAA